MAFVLICHISGMKKADLLGRLRLNKY